MPIFQGYSNTSVNCERKLKTNHVYINSSLLRSHQCGHSHPTLLQTPNRLPALAKLPLLYLSVDFSFSSSPSFSKGSPAHLQPFSCDATDLGMNSHTRQQTRDSNKARTLGLEGGSFSRWQQRRFLI